MASEGSSPPSPRVTSDREKGEGGRARERGGFWDQEPMATIRAHPRRFAWGLPAAFVLPVVAGLLIAGWNLSAAIALQLFLQTVGLLWLYIPPARARWQADRKRRMRERGESPQGVQEGDESPRG